VYVADKKEKNLPAIEKKKKKTTFMGDSGKLDWMMFSCQERIGKNNHSANCTNGEKKNLCADYDPLILR